MAHLRRWKPGTDMMETLAQWPVFFDVFEQRYLALDDDGTLTLIASREGLTAMARFQIADHAHLISVDHIHAETVGRPIVYGSTMQLVTLDGDDVALEVVAPEESEPVSIDIIEGVECGCNNNLADELATAADDAPR